MPETDLVECPHCMELVTPGNVCEECGKELTVVLAKNETEATSIESSDTQSQIQNEQTLERNLSEGDTFGSGTSTLRNTSPSTNEVLDPPTVELKPSPQGVAADNKASPTQRQKRSKPKFEGDDQDFAVQFNSARIFLEKQASAFNFRIHQNPKIKARFKDIQIEVDVGLDGHRSLKKRVWGLNADRATDVSLNLRPNVTGIEIAADLILTYKKDGEIRTMAGTFSWDCVHPNESSSKVIENLEIRLEGMSADIAADQNIHILKDLRANQPAAPADRLKHLKLSPVWEQITLYEQYQTMMSNQTTKALSGFKTDRLTLENQSRFRVQLYSLPTIRIGRSSESCEIVVRAFDDSGQMVDKEASFGLSRIQCTLSFKNGRFFVQDGGTAPDHGMAGARPSGQGTFLNGQNLSCTAAAEIPDSSESILSLGGRKKWGSALVRFVIKVIKKDKKPAALVLTRTDQVKEAYIILNHACSLQDVDTEFADAELIQNAGAFFLNFRGRHQPLFPGVVIQTDQHHWNGINLTQYGV